MSEATPEKMLQTLAEMGLATHELTLPPEVDAPVQLRTLLAGAAEQAIRVSPGRYALRLRETDGSAELSLETAQIRPIGATTATAEPVARNDDVRANLQVALDQQLAKLREITLDSEAEMCRRFDDLETVCMQLSEALAEHGANAEDAASAPQELPPAMSAAFERLAALISGLPVRLEAERRGLCRIWSALDAVLNRLEAAARTIEDALVAHDSAGTALDMRLAAIENRLEAIASPPGESAAEEAVADLRMTLAEFMARHQKLAPNALDEAS